MIEVRKGRSGNGVLIATDSETAYNILTAYRDQMNDESLNEQNPGVIRKMYAKEWKTVLAALTAMVENKIVSE